MISKNVSLFRFWIKKSLFNSILFKGFSFSIVFFFRCSDMRETFLRDATAVGLWRVSILCIMYVICYSFFFPWIFFVIKMCLTAQKTVWKKKSFVFESESTTLLLNLTNYDHISLALLVSNYYKIGHKSDCFAYTATRLIWISNFEVLKIISIQKDFPLLIRLYDLFCRSCMQWRQRKIHTRHSLLWNTALWKLN